MFPIFYQVFRQNFYHRFHQNIMSTDNENKNKDKDLYIFIELIWYKNNVSLDVEKT